MREEAAVLSPPAGGSRMRSLLKPLLLSVGPVAAALIVSGLVLVAAGGDPIAYYSYVVQRGLMKASGFQAALAYATPMLIVSAALIAGFRAGLWNLGIDGQVMVGTLAAGIVAPYLAQHMHFGAALVISLIVSAAAGALWALPMAMLKAYQGINEIISGLMMSFLASSLCAAMIKLVAGDPNSPLSPQTYSLPVEDRLPRLFGSDVSIGIVMAVVVVIGCHMLLKRTSHGLKLRLLGLSPRTARHVGIAVPTLTVVTLCGSGALGGLAGGVDLVGVLGNMKAAWNPGYGFAVVPLVFLARLNGFAVIGFVLVFAVLRVGSASAATRLGIPQDFTLIVVGLLLVFLALAEFADQRLSAKKER